MQTLKELARTIIVIMILVAGVSLVSAWTAPTQTPPGGNVSAPVNVGALSQIKSGPLQVNGFRNIGNSIFDGSVGIGTAGPTQKLDVNGDIKTNGGIWLGGQRKTEWPGALTKVTYAVGKDCVGGWCYVDEKSGGSLGWGVDPYIDFSPHYNKVCELKGAKFAASDVIGICPENERAQAWVRGGWTNMPFGSCHLTQISCWK
ncbi:hypothetical protein KJ934_02670 [Patescibacteria group bacterium]|nr:hypothetical protein [Patescibacteria group bacterium]MBU4353314.1 hypothetical protein [Patescibacteria group bacterium]MBU4477377.1 hypothetical protein [Patescibacteria group bacterium]MCG2699267.1 hypothetical protein [Candidatus Parcubacteria bacterium]